MFTGLLNCSVWSMLEIADRELNCVGYWLEDMKSYMITYDMEDAVSAFRCWVSFMSLTANLTKICL